MTEREREQRSKAGAVKTPKKAAAARENGRKSKNGGRPRRKKYLEDFKDLGAPPSHPLELARWVQRALAVDLYRQMHGRSDDALSRSLRATATAMSRALPIDIIHEAQEIIRADQAQLAGERGPTTEPVNGAAGIFVAPAKDPH